MDQEWQQLKAELQKGLSKGQFDLWVSTVEFLGVKEEELVLGCRNRLHMGWLREKLEKRMLNGAVKFFPNVRKVEYIISVDDPLDDKPEEEISDVPRQTNFSDLIKRSGRSFNPRFTYEQFVIGSCNQFAHAASYAIASGQHIASPSLYLMSDTGLGKSHLSHAVGNYLKTSRPNVRVHYVTAEQFANEMIFSLKNDCIDSFKQKYRAGCDILLMEKVEFLSGKEKVQSELVYTIDELLDRGKGIVCTGNAWPKDIPRLSNELQSRLNGILVAQIDRPDFKTRLQIIGHKVKSEGVRMPMEVVELLADRLTGDIRQIESCLVGIIAKSNILKVPITLQLAQEVTQTMLSHLPKLTVEHIQQIVCSSFQISHDDLTSPSRRRELALARKVGMYLCRQFTTEPLAAIGKAFKRSHSTVLYAVNQMTKEAKSGNSKVKRQLDYVSRRLETSCLYP